MANAIVNLQQVVRATSIHRSGGGDGRLLSMADGDQCHSRSGRISGTPGVSMAPMRKRLREAMQRRCAGIAGRPRLRIELHLGGWLSANDE